MSKIPRSLTPLDGILRAETKVLHRSLKSVPVPRSQTAAFL